MKSKSYISLDEIIKSLLIQMGEQTEHKYMQMLDIGIRGIKELTMDATQEIKLTTLTVNSNLTADLPCDFVGYRRIGVNVPGGYGVLETHSLAKSDDMAFVHDDVVGCPITVRNSSTVENLDSTSWISNYRGGENTGGVYGMGGGHNTHGAYRICREKNQIEVSSNFNTGSELILEYISDGSTDDGSYEIHIYAEEALRAYIWWKYCQRKRNHPLQEKEVARRDWYNEKRLAIARFNTFNKEEALNASRKNFRQSPNF
tara:strand:+ start:2902 stop:3675 length:774 start_codon:yes stop_codon:yes gene_type:complete